MKKYLSHFFISCMALLISSCSDKVEITRTYTIYEPVFMSLQDIRAGVEVGEPLEIKATGKIYLYKNYLLINEPGKGVHVINNSDPSNPSAIKFINIPGNFDIAVKGDVLYADSYIDMVVLDIRDINDVTLIERFEGIFNSTTYYYEPDRGIVVDWEEVKKVEISENEFGTYRSYFWYGEGQNFMAFSSDATSRSASAPSVSTGVGGSMARFTIVENYLYSIDYSYLYTFNISNLQAPIQEATKYAGWNIETIFPYENKLFLGSSNGLYIYDISAPASPEFISMFAHISSCDPVVVQDTLAFVTLRGGTECGGFTNQLDVINIKDPSLPYLIKSYPMSGPYGLGIDGTTLFICDGSAGLKVYNISDIYNIDKNRIKTYKDIDAYDVIPFNNILIMIGKDGLYQFDYSNTSNITLLSKLEIK